MRSINDIKKNYTDRLGRKQGYWVYYWSNGNIFSDGTYKDDKLNGIWYDYFQDGGLASKGLYKNDKREGN